MCVYIQYVKGVGP